MKTENITPIEPKRSSFPTWGDMLAILGLFFLTQLITASGFMLAGQSQVAVEDITNLTTELQRVAEQDMGRTVLLWTLVSQSLFFLSVLALRAFRGGKWGAVSFSYRGFNPTILLWGFVMLISLSIVMEPLLDLFPEPPIPVGRGAYMILAIVVAAPIFEELICRGIILESIKAKYGAWLGCLLSSVIFGVMHIQPQLVINAFAMGLILGYIYLRTRSIFAPMILHSINNLMAYIFIIFGVSQISLHELIGNKNIYLLIYAMAVGVMILSVVAISKRLKLLELEERTAREAKEAKRRAKVLAEEVKRAEAQEIKAQEAEKKESEGEIKVEGQTFQDQ